MPSDDWAVAMRYPVPFTFAVDGLEEFPYQRRRQPPGSSRRDIFQEFGNIWATRYRGSYGDDPRGGRYFDECPCSLRSHEHHGDWIAGLQSHARPVFGSRLEEEYYSNRVRGNGFLSGCPRCGQDQGQHSHSNRQPRREYAVKTKDVTIRGKSYAIRKSFLADMSKFESELVKFVDKKTEEEVPERIVKLLVDFINEESCDTKSALDLVGLNILASNLGAKSAVENSLRELKKFEFDYRMSVDELTRICGAITMSGRVDRGLEIWLKKFIQETEALCLLQRSQSFRALLYNHPEVEARLEKIMGWREEDENSLGLMIM